MKPTTCKPFILETHNTRTLIFADGLVETLLLAGLSQVAQRTITDPTSGYISVETFDPPAERHELRAARKRTFKRGRAPR